MVVAKKLISIIKRKNKALDGNLQLYLNNKIYHAYDISEEDIKIKNEYHTVPVIYFTSRKKNKFTNKILLDMIEKDDRAVFISINNSEDYKSADDISIIENNITLIKKKKERGSCPRSGKGRT